MIFRAQKSWETIDAMGVCMQLSSILQCLTQLNAKMAKQNIFCSSKHNLSVMLVISAIRSWFCGSVNESQLTVVTVPSFSQFSTPMNVKACQGRSTHVENACWAWLSTMNTQKNASRRLCQPLMLFFDTKQPWPVHTASIRSSSHQCCQKSWFCSKSNDFGLMSMNLGFSLWISQSDNEFLQNVMNLSQRAWIWYEAGLSAMNLVRGWTAKLY